MNNIDEAPFDDGEHDWHAVGVDSHRFHGGERSTCRGGSGVENDGAEESDTLEALACGSPLSLLCFTRALVNESRRVTVQNSHGLLPRNGSHGASRNRSSGRSLNAGEFMRPLSFRPLRASRQRQRQRHHIDANTVSLPFVSFRSSLSATLDRCASEAGDEAYRKIVGDV